MDFVDLAELARLRDKKLITVRPHPEADLFIANYTPQVQFDRLWGESPLLPSCRGLIYDSTGKIHARPFRKFFNYGEYDGPIPTSRMNISEKMDGSLGILYWVGDQPRIATRGSFQSEQALEGTRILEEKYSDVGFDRGGWTYLFEIIYPENRIVVDYGTERDLVLIGVVDEEWNDVDVKYVPWPGRKPIRYHYPHGERTIQMLAKTELENFEGFVIHWPEEHLRLKVKLEEYLRLHKVLTGVSARTIWQALKNGDNLDMWIENVPDEFADFIRDTVASLTARFEDIARLVEKDFAQVMANFKGFAYPDRKQFAMEAKKYHTADMLFLMFDGRPWKDRIWKSIYPDADSPTFKLEV